MFAQQFGGKSGYLLGEVMKLISFKIKNGAPKVKLATNVLRKSYKHRSFLKVRKIAFKREFSELVEAK